MEKFYVYILTSQRNGTLYIGITNDLARRVDEHREGAVSGFTTKYHVHILIYYEMYDDAEEAIHREKNLKAWKRLWKLQLIESINPDWQDLSAELLN